MNQRRRRQRRQSHSFKSSFHSETPASINMEIDLNKYSVAKENNSKSFLNLKNNDDFIYNPLQQSTSSNFCEILSLVFNNFMTFNRSFNESQISTTRNYSNYSFYKFFLLILFGFSSFFVNGKFFVKNYFVFLIRHFFKN